MTDSSGGGGGSTHFCQVAECCSVGTTTHACALRVPVLPEAIKKHIDDNKDKKRVFPEEYWDKAKNKYNIDADGSPIQFYSCLAVKIIHLRKTYDEEKTEKILLQQPGIVECVNQSHKAILHAALIKLPGHPLFNVTDPISKKKKLISGRNLIELKLRDLISIFGNFKASEQKEKYGLYLVPSVAPWQISCFTKIMLSFEETEKLLMKMYETNQDSNYKTTETVNKLVQLTERLSNGLDDVNKKINAINNKQAPKSVVNDIKDTLAEIVKDKTAPKFNANESDKLQKNQIKANAKIQAERELLANKKAKTGSSLMKGTLKSDDLKRKSELVRLYLRSSHFILDEQSICDISRQWDIDDSDKAGSLRIIELAKNHKFSSYCVWFKSKSNDYKRNIPIGVSWKHWKGSLPIPSNEKKSEKDLFLGRISKEVTEEQVKRKITTLFPDADKNKIRLIFTNYWDKKKGRKLSWQKDLKFAYCHLISTKCDAELVMNNATSVPFDVHPWRDIIPPKTNFCPPDKFDDYEQNPSSLNEYSTLITYNQNDWTTVE